VDNFPRRTFQMNNEILTLKDLSKYLKVDEKTIYRILQEKRIPSFKVRGHWRFKKKTIDYWIDQQNPLVNERRYLGRKK